jgi:hypothetical protein
VAEAVAPTADQRPTRRRKAVVGAALVVVLAVSLLVTAQAEGWWPDRSSTLNDGQKSPAVPAGASRRAVNEVQNKVAIGPSQLVEDTTPAYLSSRPVPFCSRRGCVVKGSRGLWSGAVLVAVCSVQGTLFTNADLGSSGIEHNVEKVSSTLWYRARMANDVEGYLPEAFVTRAGRGGLGLPSCPEAQIVDVGTPLDP